MFHVFVFQFIDLATIDVLRDRERGIPRYNQFRRLLQMKPKASFRDLSDDPVIVDELKAIYNNDLESVDLLVGCLAESPRPPGFGFSETAFQVFVLMANRRLMTDRYDILGSYFPIWNPSIRMVFV